MSDCNNPIRQKSIAEAFKGKTIAHIDSQSVNVWEFHFTDGTSEKLWAEQAVYTAAGCIPGLFLDKEIGG